jgi:hypothetical protein
MLWLGQHQTDAGIGPGWLALAVAGALYLADWFSGFVHWATDTWFDEVFLERIISIAREHHLYPREIVGYGFRDYVAYSSWPNIAFVGPVALALTFAGRLPWPRRDYWPARETPRSAYAGPANPSPHRVRGRAPATPSARGTSSLFSLSSFPDRPSLCSGRQASRWRPVRRSGALASGRSPSYTAIPLTRHNRHRYRRKAKP